MVKTLSSSKPQAVVMVGAPGVGKSQFAARFSETFSAPIVSIDSLSETIFPDIEQSREKVRILSSVADAQIEQLLKTKKTIVIDGLGDTKTSRIDIKRRAHTNGYEALFVWVQTDGPTAMQRVLKPARNSPKKAASKDVYTFFSKRFTPPTEDEKPTVISGKHTYAAQLKVVLRRIVEPRTETSSVPVPAQRTEKEPAQKRTGRSILIR